MSTRRDFLQCGGCFMLAVTAGLGLPAEAMKLPVFETTGTGERNLQRYPTPPGDSVNVDYKAQVLLARYENQAFAFSLACPHQQAVVKWLPKDHRFQCTKHGSRYTPEGVYTSGRATRNLDRFAIQLDGGDLVVNLGEWFRSDTQAAAWSAASVKLQ